MVAADTRQCQADMGEELEAQPPSRRRNTAALFDVSSPSNGLLTKGLASGQKDKDWPRNLPHQAPSGTLVMLVLGVRVARDEGFSYSHSSQPSGQLTGFSVLTGLSDSRVRACTACWNCGIGIPAWLGGWVGGIEGRSQCTRTTRYSIIYHHTSHYVYAQKAYSTATKKLKK